MTDVRRPTSPPVLPVPPAGPPRYRPGVLDLLLWALLALGVAGNAAASAGVGPDWLSLALGGVTAGCAIALLLLHLRRR